jgi:DnaK suppressor protein
VNSDVAQKRKKPSKKKNSNNKKQAPKARLSPALIKHFQELLLQKRKELQQNVSEIEGETLRKSRLDASGDLSSMPIHMADLGTDNFQQEFSLELMDSERRLLVEIDDALNRIENGVYGICEGTGKPITRLRLEAQPWARYSIEYARMLEQGLVRDGE